ncbi:hypothetical protein MBRA1_003824 [Malassezia brasiliensis]|uniref:Uncharacterized protein n=1 Tax=Malassezia brasiliensis TaxID=1821822 RepID=A0AAF0IUP9_9BASI|nr:hypothetical protein MBRA1_003824 [Malassezia brasiliensis]
MDSSSSADSPTRNPETSRSSDAGPTSSDNNASSSRGGGGGGGNTSSNDDASSSNGASPTSDNASSTSSNGGGGGGGGGGGSSSSDAGPTSNSSSDGAPSSSDNGGNSSSGSSSGGAASSSGSSSGGGGASSSGSASSSSSGGGASSSGGSSSGSSSGSGSSSSGPTSGSSGSSSGGAGPTGSSSNSSSSDEMSTSTSLYVFTTNGTPTTSVVLSTVTLHPKGQLSNDNANSNSYWHDHGAVGGTFAAVGIVAVGLIAALGWFLYRRHKAKRMDADVVAAASAAAATTRTPFDDDDDEMNEAAAHYPQSHMEAVPYPYSTDAAAAPQPFYESPGYHAPNHYANTELPRAYPSLADDPYGSDLGACENPMEYYSRPPAASMDSSRGAYANVPTDSAYSYNRPLYESVPGAPPLMYANEPGSSAAPVAAYQNPFGSNATPPASDPAVAERAAQPSERTSTSTDYDLARSQADSHATHFVSVPDSSLAYRQAAPGAAPAPGAPAALGAAVPGTHTYAAAAPPVTQPSYTPPVAARASDDVSPPYVAGPSAPAVSDTKTAAPGGEFPAAQEPAQLVQFGQPSPDAHAGSKAPFADTEQDHSDTQLEHGEWDPPALSSAWFPAGTANDAPAAPPTTSTHTSSQQPMHSVGGVYEAETASVEDAPARLVVRNPSPEDVEE